MREEPSGRLLGPLQRLMLGWAEFHPYNAVDVADVEGPLDVARLAEVGDAPLSIEAEAPGEPPLAALERVAVRELNAPFPPAPAGPFRLFVLPSGGMHRVGLVWDHWAADGFSSARRLGALLAGSAGAPSFPSPDLTRRQEGPAALGTVGGAARILGRVAGSVADLIRMRRVLSPSCGARDDLRVEARILPLPPGTIAGLLAAARRRGVTLHDLLLASLARSIGEATPGRVDRRRSQVALGSVIDTRKYRPDGERSSFALDHFPVFVSPGEDREFESLVRRIAGQTRRRKAPGRTGQGELEALAANALRPLLRQGSETAFLRRNYVLSAGISNQRLPDGCLRSMGELQVSGFRRFVPAGPVCPLAFGLVTGAAPASLTVTWRRTGYPPEERAAILAGFLERLCEVAASGSVEDHDQKA